MTPSASSQCKERGNSNRDLKSLKII
jgi:hypothetical protein